MKNHDDFCRTPCTYTECILSVFFSGIPSVYVTGGHTVISRMMASFPAAPTNLRDHSSRSKGVMSGLNCYHYYYYKTV
jgi:hypothetical protein